MKRILCSIVVTLPAKRWRLSMFLLKMTFRLSKKPMRARTWGCIVIASL